MYVINDDVILTLATLTNKCRFNSYFLTSKHSAFSIFAPSIRKKKSVLSNVIFLETVSEYTNILMIIK